MVEEVVRSEGSRSVKSNSSEVARPLRDIDPETLHRTSTGIAEVDRVLGGGIVPGGFVLLGGDPGIGKSTLLLQIAAKVSALGPVLYVTGEESASQLRLRAERLGAVEDGLYIMAHNDIHRVAEAITSKEWELVIVDSLQTIFNPQLESAPGSVAQVRDIASRLMQLAKQGCPVFLVGHVNKEGSILRPVA